MSPTPLRKQFGCLVFSSFWVVEPTANRLIAPVAGTIPVARSAWSASEICVEVRQDSECLASGEIEAALRRQPRKWCAPLLWRWIESLGNRVRRSKTEGRMKSLDD